MVVRTFPADLLTTSGLSILLHAVFSHPDATSYDKHGFVEVPHFFHHGILQWNYRKMTINGHFPIIPL